MGRDAFAVKEGWVWIKRGLLGQDRVWLRVSPWFVSVVDSEREENSWSENTLFCRVAQGWGSEIVIRCPKRSVTIKPEGDRSHCATWRKVINVAIRPDFQDFYEVGGLIGYGSTSLVLSGVDRLTGLKVALKMMHRGEREESARTLKRFLREVNAMRAAESDHVVKLLDTFGTADFLVIVMENCRGGALLNRILDRGTLLEDDARHVMRQLLEALSVLHARGIVHRDVKLDNILCAEKDGSLHVKLADFGFAAMGELDPYEAIVDSFRGRVGTSVYMAWEMWTGKRYGMQVDSFALGVILFALLSGNFPFPFDGVGDLDDSVNGPSFDGAEWDGVSESAKSLIRGLLHRDPLKRTSAFGALQHRWFTEENNRGYKLFASSENLKFLVDDPRPPKSHPIMKRIASGAIVDIAIGARG